MNLSVLIARRVSPRVRFLTRTTFSYRLIVCVVMVACFVLPPQMSSMDEGNEDSAPPVTALVSRASPFRSPTEGQERAGTLTEVRTTRIWADKGVGTVEFNPVARDGRSILSALCLLRC